MKTKTVILTLLAGLFLTFTAQANEPVPASKAVAKIVAKEIQQGVAYPEFAIEQQFECCVVVNVVILEDGGFAVDCANCVCDRMKKDIMQQIRKLKSEDLAKYAGQTVVVKLKFDLKLV